MRITQPATLKEILSRRRRNQPYRRLKEADRQARAARRRGKGRSRAAARRRVAREAALTLLRLE